MVDDSLQTPLRPYHCVVAFPARRGAFWPGFGQAPAFGNAEVAV